MTDRPTIDRGHCQKCHQRVLWVHMRKADGSRGGRMPLNPEWVISDGTKHLIVTDEDNFGHLIRSAPDGTTGRESHFSNCPAAEHFRKKKKLEEVQRSLFE